MTVTTVTTDQMLAVAGAVAAQLPSSEPLEAIGVQPGSEQVVASFAAATLAEIDGPLSGRLAILVGGDLVAALAQSPIAGLDLAAATQPALDAAAAALGCNARPATQVGLDLVVTDLAPTGGFSVVPLVGSAIAAAVMVPDTLEGTELPSAAPGPETRLAPVADALPPGAPSSAMRAQAPASASGATRGIEMLHGVDMEVTVEIGRTRMTVRDLLGLTPGAVLELDRAAGSPADLLVNGRLIARGEVVVVDEDFGLRVTEIVDDAAAS